MVLYDVDCIVNKTEEEYMLSPKAMFSWLFLSWILDIIYPLY